MNSPTVYSNKYPPINRTTPFTDILRIEIVDGNGVQVFDPTAAAIAGVTGQLALGEPVGKSVLSGEPGYHYRTCDLEMTLTREELLRLMTLHLRPDEVLKLLALYGAFHEIHDDFVRHVGALH